MCLNFFIELRIGGEEMFIGEIVANRMKLLGLTTKVLSDETFIDEKLIKSLVNNKISINEMDFMDLEFISEALYCDVEYFLDEKKMEKDVLNSSLNRGTDSVKSNIVKVKLQSIMNDFDFISNIYRENESGV